MTLAENRCDVVILISVCNEAYGCSLNSLELFIPLLGRPSKRVFQPEEGVLHQIFGIQVQYMTKNWM